MTFCKSKILHILLITFVLSACSRNSTPRTAQNDTSGDALDSTFVVDTPVTLVQAKQSVQNNLWSLAVQNAMTFKACMKDVFNNQPIVGEKFLVGWDSSQQTQKSDNEGCVSWTQIIAFDFLKDEAYVASSTFVEGAGAYRGHRQLPLALDPWVIDDTALVDTRAEPSLTTISGSSVNEALAVMKSSLTKSSTQTVIDKVMVEALDNRYTGNAAAIHYRLTLSPQVTRRGIKGDIVASPLATGQFRLSLTLIEHRLQATADQDQRIVLAEATVDAPDVNGLINVDVPMSLQRKPNDQSLIELAFQLSPVDPPFTLLPREGFVQMSSLYSGGDPTVHELTTNYSSYQAKIREQTQLASSIATTNDSSASSANPSCDDGSTQLGFYLSSIDVRNTGANSRTTNENVPNSEIAAFAVCLSDSISKKPVNSGLSVDASLSNQDGSSSSTQSLVTDGNGCLHFTYPIAYDFFAAETWLEKSLHLSSHSSPYQGVNRNFPVSLDPWQNKDLYFWDCRNGQKATPSGKNVEMEMTDFSTNSIGQDYSIDAAMNLTVNRRYQFQITPRLKISSAFGGITSYQEVLDGTYHMRVLVLTPNQDNNVSDIIGMDANKILANYKYLSSYDSDVHTRDGRITEEVVLPVNFSELPLLGLRNTLLIQITPIGVNSSMTSHPYYEAFLGMSANSYLGLSPVAKSAESSNSGGSTAAQLDIDIASLIQTGKQSKATMLGENTSLDALAASAHLKIPSSDDLNSANINEDYLQSLFASNQPSAPTAKKLCALLSANNSASWLKTCNSNPLAHLQFAKFQHVEAVNAGASIIDSKYIPISVVAQISVSTEKSNGTSVDNSTASTSSNSSDRSVVSSSSADNSSTRSNDSSVSKGDTGSKGIEASTDVKATGSVKTGINLFGTGADVGVETSAGVSASMGHSWFTTQSNTVSSTNSVSNTNSHSNSSGRTKSNSTSKSHTVSKTSNSSSAQNASVSLSYNKDFGVEELVFGIKGDVRNCYGIRAVKSKAPGILLCSSSVSSKQDWHESYYLVSELYGFSQLAPLRDAYSRSDAPLALAIRGDAAYNAVQTLLIDKNKSILLSATKVDSSGLANLDRPLEDFARTTPQFSDGSFPSLIY